MINGNPANAKVNKTIDNTGFSSDSLPLYPINAAYVFKRYHLIVKRFMHSLDDGINAGTNLSYLELLLDDGSRR
jgi:hypothetical protein